MAGSCRAFILQSPWRLWVSVPPAPGEGWGPRSDVGQFALLQGDREAYANVLMVVGLSFEEQTGTDLGAPPLVGLCTCNPSGSWCFEGPVSL